MALLIKSPTPNAVVSSNFPINHKWFDAQRGLKIVLSALKSSSTVEESLLQSGAMPDLVHLKLNLDLVQSKAKEVRKSVTQFLMERILDVIPDETVRMIISQEKEISEIGAGNFTPLDLKERNGHHSS